MACHQEFPQVLHDGGKVGQQGGLGSCGCRTEPTVGGWVLGFLGEPHALPPAPFPHQWPPGRSQPAPWPGDCWGSSEAAAYIP